MREEARTRFPMSQILIESILVVMVCGHVGKLLAQRACRGPCAALQCDLSSSQLTTAPQTA